MTEGDFRGRRLEDADFSRARLHGANFEATVVTDGWFRGADLSGDIAGLVVNGVEVAPLVEAERDRRFPERRSLRSAEPEVLRSGWAVLVERWGGAEQRAAALGEAVQNTRVHGEWSFLETLRHLVFATDTWIARMVRHERAPFHPLGLAGSWLSDPASLGLTYDARPSFDEVLVARRSRQAVVATTLEALDATERDRVCEPPEETGHPSWPCTVLECLHVVLQEEWEHLGYAERDLALLESGSET